MVGALISMVPVSELPARLAAGMFCGLIETLTVLGVVPLMVSVVSQPPELVTATLKFTPDGVLITLSGCDAGVLVAPS